MTRMTVNGQAVDIDAEPGTPILWALRDHMHLNGTKFGCGAAQCGACTVHLNGAPVRSCVVPATEGAVITTIEAMADDRVGQAVVAAWIANDVAQCGYCQSGQVMSTVALLKRIKKPSDAQIDEALSGNLCRCGTYVRIRAAVHAAAAALV